MPLDAVAPVPDLLTADAPAAAPDAATAQAAPASASEAAPAQAPATGIEPVGPAADAAAEAASHYDRSTIRRAKAGEVVARVAADLAATALGEGVVLGADGFSVIATTDGRVVIEDGAGGGGGAARVHIAKSLEIPGNVDFSTGNIEFPHDVAVAGNVADLFRVHAGGRLEVRGVVEAADVRAGAGMHAAGGISAKNKGRVVVDGDLESKYVANATVAATGNVASLTVVNSRVICGGELKVSEGPVLAGHVTATGGVRCEVAGSTAGVKTILEVAVDESLRVAAQAKVPEIEAMRRKAAKVRETVEPLMRNQKKLNAQQKERATELLFEADEQEQQANEILAQLRKLYDAVAARAKNEVLINQTLYAGVVIRFPGVYTVIDAALQGPVRVTTKTMHNETRIVLYYGGGRTAHTLVTHADPDPHAEALKKLLAPAAAAAPGANSK